MKKIDVSIKPFLQLFDKRRMVVVPEYQRPYVWGKEKSEELLKDLEEYFLNGAVGKPYYMGAILYYYNRREDRYEIIDGQQRITTLLIMLKLISGADLPDYQDIVYNSHQSVRSIKEAKEFFLRNNHVLIQLNKKGFLDKVNFTLIITHSEDDAFTFFDTQNNRGIKLGSTDFLKAYHLRAIKSELLQERFARKWESSSIRTIEGPLLPHIFEKVLWRSRNWKGQTKIDFENKEAILRTFQKSTIKQENPSSYPLYPSYFNRQAVGHLFNEQGELQIIQSVISQSSEADYPFSLRQPLHKGINFFRYTDKYIAIYQLLFQPGNAASQEIELLRQFYDSVYTFDTSLYLRHFMQLCLISYYDVFGTSNILNAAYGFDYLIGSIRMQKQQIKKEAISRCLKDDLPYNLLDVISSAYLPDEIFQFVYGMDSIDKIYEEENVKMNDGVRGRYKARVLNYFKKEENTLSNRKAWGRI